MTESTGISGRLPVLSNHVNEPQVLRTGDLEKVARGGRRVGVETTDGCITYRHIRGRHGRIERDSKNRAVRQNEIAAGHVHPIRLGRNAGSEIKSNLDVAVVGADNRDALIFGRILDLVDEGTISERALAKVGPSGRPGGLFVMYQLLRGCCAVDRFPNAGRASNQMAAAGRRACGSAIVSSGNAAVEKIVGQNE